jgi:hypothetical protein
MLCNLPLSYFAAQPSAEVGQHQHITFRITVEDNIINPNDCYLDCQLFPNLPDNAIPGIFPLLDLSAREFPEKRIGCIRAAPGKKYQPVMFDDGSGHQEAMHQLLRFSESFIRKKKSGTGPDYVILV